MAIEALKYHWLNRVRQSIRLMKKNFLLFFAVAFFSVFLLSMLEPIAGVIREHNTVFEKWGSFIFLIYCIAKIMQDYPTINIPIQFLSVKAVNLGFIKGYVFVKSILFSLGIFMVFMLMDISLSKTLVVALLINGLANLMCFYKTQVSSLLRSQTIFLSIIILIYLADSVALASLVLAAMIILFLVRKSLKYDDIYKYYYAYGGMLEGIVSNDFARISTVQSSLSKSKVKSKFAFLEKFYENAVFFYYFKEISRMTVCIRPLINAYFVTFVCCIAPLFYGGIAWLGGVAILVIILVMDNILTRLNKPEAINKKNGFYLPFTPYQLLIQKYLPHVTILIIPLLMSTVFLTGVSRLALVAIFLLLPVKSVVMNFSTTWRGKMVAYLMDGILFSLCFGELLNYLINSVIGT
jgi:hypothetical protein